MASKKQPPVNDLAAQFGALRVGGSFPVTRLPFSPPKGFKKAEIPRYLFRISSHHSHGHTAPDLALSFGATRPNLDSKTCIFNMDAEIAAEMVHKHLAWNHCENLE